MRAMSLEAMLPPAELARIKTALVPTHGGHSAHRHVATEAVVSTTSRESAVLETAMTGASAMPMLTARSARFEAK